ncbi:MAG: hypothetical protein ACLFPA_08405 [Dichotomicrobium sp.]
MTRIMFASLAAVAMLAMLAGDTAKAQSAYLGDAHAYWRLSDANRAGAPRQKTDRMSPRSGSTTSRRSGAVPGSLKVPTPGPSKHIEGTDVSTGGTCSKCGDE